MIAYSIYDVSMMNLVENLSNKIWRFGKQMKVKEKYLHDTS